MTIVPTRRWVTTLALATALAMPAAAAPMVPHIRSHASPEFSSHVIEVQQRDRRNRFERRGNRAYWRGHRGYRDQRPGYRRHNGWWFPPAAFALGAILGGVTSGARTSNAHVRWCQNRYRSYRASDNTFQPYNGPRRPCWSPYN